MTPDLLDTRSNASAPPMILVVDGSLRIRFMNAEAARTLRSDGARGGACETLHGLHAPGACGPAADCADCAILEAVASVAARAEVSRRFLTLSVQRGARLEEVHLAVSARPFRSGDGTFSLLCLERADDRVRDGRVVPVCFHCHRVRNGNGTWTAFPAFLPGEGAVEFSHGTCPDCRQHSGAA